MFNVYCVVHHFLWWASCYLTAISWTLMLSLAMESRRSGSLILRKSGRSCTSQFMSKRCNKQVCTHDRAGSRALESRIAHITSLHSKNRTWSQLTTAACHPYVVLDKVLTFRWGYWSLVLLPPAWAPTHGRKVAPLFLASARSLTAERNNWKTSKRSFLFLTPNVSTYDRTTNHPCLNLAFSGNMRDVYNKVQSLILVVLGKVFLAREQLLKEQDAGSLEEVRFSKGM